MGNVVGVGSYVCHCAAGDQDRATGMLMELEQDHGLTFTGESGPLIEKMMAQFARLRDDLAANAKPVSSSDSSRLVDAIEEALYQAEVEDVDRYWGTDERRRFVQVLEKALEGRDGT